MTTKEEQLIIDFNNLVNNLKDWGSKVDLHILDILSDFKDMIKIPPKFRLKDDKSFIEKAFYRKKEYSNPLVDIEDKIGTRIVILKTDDISPISDLILKSEFWDAKITKSQKQEIEDKPNLFDYQSQHIVVTPKSNGFYNNDICDQLSCEIQIRTLLQHAFAEISHDSTYKGPYKNDKEILRHLSKSMALMEATDDYFCTIFAMMDDSKRKYKNYLKELTELYSSLGFSLSSDNFLLDLNDSLLELLEKKDVSINSVSTYINENEKELKECISKGKSLILSQPISLLVAYYQNYNQSFLKDNWPLNITAYSNFINDLGYSSSNY